MKKNQSKTKQNNPPPPPSPAWPGPAARGAALGRGAERSGAEQSGAAPPGGREAAAGPAAAPPRSPSGLGRAGPAPSAITLCSRRRRRRGWCRARRGSIFEAGDAGRAAPGAWRRVPAGGAPPSAGLVLPLPAPRGSVTAFVRASDLAAVLFSPPRNTPRQTTPPPRHSHTRALPARRQAGSGRLRSASQGASAERAAAPRGNARALPETPERCRRRKRPKASRSAWAGAGRAAPRRALGGGA